MKIQGLLPIGSVVMLEGGEHRLMITGYGHHLPDSDEVSDYVGCPWPEGILRADQNYLFNGDTIAEVFFLGYQTDGQKVLVAKMEAALADYRSRSAEKQ